MVLELLNLFAWIPLLINTFFLLTIAYAGFSTSYIDMEWVLES